MVRSRISSATRSRWAAQLALLRAHANRAGGAARSAPRAPRRHWRAAPRRCGSRPRRRARAASRSRAARGSVRGAGACRCRCPSAARRGRTRPRRRVRSASAAGRAARAASSLARCASCWLPVWRSTMREARLELGAAGGDAGEPRLDLAQRRARPPGCRCASPPRRRAALSPAMTRSSVTQPGRRLDRATMSAAMRASSTKTCGELAMHPGRRRRRATQQQRGDRAQRCAAGGAPRGAAARRRCRRRPPRRLAGPMSTASGPSSVRARPARDALAAPPGRRQDRPRGCRRGSRRARRRPRLRSAARSGRAVRGQVDGLGAAVVRDGAALDEALALQPVQGAHQGRCLDRRGGRRGPSG